MVTGIDCCHFTQRMPPGVTFAHIVPIVLRDAHNKAIDRSEKGVVMATYRKHRAFAPKGFSSARDVVCNGWVKPNPRVVLASLMCSAGQTAILTSNGSMLPCRPSRLPVHLARPWRGCMMQAHRISGLPLTVMKGLAILVHCRILCRWIPANGMTWRRIMRKVVCAPWLILV